MTSDNGNENTPRREAMTGRGDVDPLVHRHAQDARATGPGTPPTRPSATPARPPAGSRPPADGSRETANPFRSTADDTRTVPADDRDTRAGQGADMRAGQQKAMRAMQPDSARAGQGGDPTGAGQPESRRDEEAEFAAVERGEPTRAGQQESARAGQGGPPPRGSAVPVRRGKATGRCCRTTSEQLLVGCEHAVGGFVDGPRAAVEEADHVLEELTTEFTDAMTRRRRTLRTTWQAAGESDTADTEKLRLALQLPRGDRATPAPVGDRATPAPVGERATPLHLSGGRTIKIPP